MRALTPITAATVRAFTIVLVIEFVLGWSARFSPANGIDSSGGLGEIS